MNVISDQYGISEIVILAACFQQFHSCLSAAHIYDFHIFIFMYIHYRRVYEELTIDHLSMWLIAQWIQDCTGIARSWVRAPFKPEFFEVAFSTA